MFQAFLDYFKRTRIAYDFTYTEKLGSGAGGTVYAGTWKNMPVAVKKFNPGQNEYYFKEKDILVTLDHPNVIKLIGCLEVELRLTNTCFLLLELMNQSFYDYLCEHTGAHRKQEKCDRILLGIAKGLVYLHSIGIIHGDIKSGNILLDNNLDSKIADFDSSMRLKNGEEVILYELAGSDRYSAPELYTGFYTRAYDSFPLAWMLWICAVPDFVKPFENIDNSDHIRAIYKAGIRPDVPTRLSEERKNLITFGWDVDPKKRPPANEYVSVLEREIKIHSKHL